MMKKKITTVSVPPYKSIYLQRRELFLKNDNSIINDRDNLGWQNLSFYYK